jgi:hypothetical protein
MQTQLLKQLYLFELENLRQEISLYKNETNIWIVDKQITNSGGNLCLHILGNLQHFIGTTLLNTGYVRNREAEFTEKNWSKETLQTKTLEVISLIHLAFEKLTDEDLLSIYPYDFMGTNTTGFYLTRFLSHLSYHLGQINYHRRLLDV